MQIIEKLQNQDQRIRIFHHENKINKGRSASRNLALQNVSQPYIAFLDADDFYLKNRFDTDSELFELEPSIDGVYNAIGVHFYRESSLEEQQELNLTTTKEAIQPAELFDYLLNGKKNLLENAEILFSQNLQLK